MCKTSARNMINYTFLIIPYHSKFKHAKTKFVFNENRKCANSLQKSMKNFFLKIVQSEMEFKEFEPRFKSAKTRFKFSAGLNLETFDTILSGTKHI